MLNEPKPVEKTFKGYISEITIEEMAKRLKTQTVSGIKWQVGVSLLHKIISFAATIILARLLGPSDFGLFALTMVVVSSFELFKSIGIDSALIRKKDNFEIAANTAFVIIPLLGVILYVVLNFGAPIIGKMLNNSKIINVVRVLGITFVFSCFAKIPQSLLERNLQFKQISIGEFVSAIVFSLSAIILALLRFGVWSLVYAYIIKILCFSIIIWSYSKWKPVFSFDKKIALEMLNFGKFVFLASVAWFLRMNLDNLMVGNLLGVTMLGYYAIAFNIANFGADYFGNKVYRVIYPAYSKLQDDRHALRTLFLKTLKHISIIAFPLGIGIFLLGGDFLRIAYGEKWLHAISVLRILAFAGIFNVLPAATGAVFLAIGKPKISFFTTIIQVTMFFLFISPMTRAFGINGVGFIVSASSIIAFAIELLFASKLLNLDFVQLSGCFTPAVRASFFMTIVVYSFKNLMNLKIIYSSLLINFLLIFSVATLTYLFTLFVYNKNELKEIKQIVF